MSSPSLHYVFDPLCGWCYAVGPVLRRLVDTLGDAVPIRFHPGLLFATPRVIDAGLREHIVLADARIAALSGVSFGDAYLQRVRFAPHLEYDSTPSAAAVMAVNAVLPEATVDMLEAIQTLHYMDGGNVSDVTVLAGLAHALDVPSDRFLRAMNRIVPALPLHAQRARELSQRVSGGGIPGFLLEVDGRLWLLDHNRAHSNPEALISQISECIGECVQ